MTANTHARVACGERVRITVTLLDGSPVAELEADPVALDGIHHYLTMRADNGVLLSVPLEPVDATVLPLPRPRPTSGGAA